MPAAWPSPNFMVIDQKVSGENVKKLFTVLMESAHDEPRGDIRQEPKRPGAKATLNWPRIGPRFAAGAASTGSASNVTGGSHGSTDRDLSDTATVPCFE